MKFSESLFARGIIGVLLFVGITFAMVSCIAEPDAPPKPRSSFEGPQQETPVHVARVRAQCYPVFTDEERQKLYEKCDRDGGRIRGEHAVISCFKIWSADYDEAIWSRYAEDYPRSELSEPLPSWVMTEGYRVVKVQ